MRKLAFFLAIWLFLFALPVVAKTENGYVVKLEEKSAISLFSATESAPSSRYITVDTEADAKLLLEMGLAELYAENFAVRLFDVPQDLDWATTSMQLPLMRDCRFTGEGVTVGIIDTGIRSTHPEFAGRILNGWNTYANNTDTQDENGHGTFVSSILAAATGPGEYALSLPTVGTAPLSKILPIKCFGSGNTTTISCIANGIDYVVSHQAETNCRILNMSLGASLGVGTDEYNLFLDAVQRAQAAGITIVAAVGNYSSSIGDSSYTAINYPAGFPGVIGVGSVNKNSQHSWFSVYNESVDIVAPGEEVLGATYSSAQQTDTYAIDSGTSFSAPFVSGVLALALQYDSTLTTEELETALTATATDLGEAGRDNYYGYGLLHVPAFLGRLFPESAGLCTLCSNDFSTLSYSLRGPGYHVDTLQLAGAYPSVFVPISTFPHLSSLTADDADGANGFVMKAGSGHTIYTVQPTWLLAAQYAADNSLCDFSTASLEPGFSPLPACPADTRIFLWSSHLSPLQADYTVSVQSSK
ncbi:MAG: S8 family serine peptidase [Clostridia bacterium]|nr:S8 family serine peptidase [Clostridia bacterium]